MSDLLSHDERLTLPKHSVPGKVGVVTVLYNSSDVLPEFFFSIDQQSYQNIVVYCIDNLSNDDSVQQCRTRDSKYVVIENERNIGVAAANNQGIRTALADGCDAVLLLNNDTVFPPDLIELLAAGLDRYRCDMIAPKIYYHDRPNVIWCAGGRFHLLQSYHTEHVGVGRIDTGQYDAPRFMPYVPTCCLLIRREVFGLVGMMDSRYFVYSDDADFLYRCLQKDIQVWYLPEAKLWHKVSSLTGSASEFSAHYCTRNRIYFLRKHLPYWLALSLYLQSQLRSTAAFLLGRISLSSWKRRRKSSAEGWQMLGRHYRQEQDSLKL
jgi:GT2 family glycosyltransferase